MAEMTKAQIARARAIPICPSRKTRQVEKHRIVRVLVV